MNAICGVSRMSGERGKTGERGERAERCGRVRRAYVERAYNVILKELNARREVGLVELIHHVEAQRAELSPLLHDRVHKAEGVQYRFEYGRRRSGYRVEVVLCEPRIRALQTSTDAGGRLVGGLDRYLQQSNWEARVRLGLPWKGDCASELVNVSRPCHADGGVNGGVV